MIISIDESYQKKIDFIIALCQAQFIQQMVTEKNI